MLHSSNSPMNASEYLEALPFSISPKDTLANKLEQPETKTPNFQYVDNFLYLLSKFVKKINFCSLLANINTSLCRELLMLTRIT